MANAGSAALPAWTERLPHPLVAHLRTGFRLGVGIREYGIWCMLYGALRLRATTRGFRVLGLDFKV